MGALITSEVRKRYASQSDIESLAESLDGTEVITIFSSVDDEQVSTGGVGGDDGAASIDEDGVDRAIDYGTLQSSQFESTVDVEAAAAYLIDGDVGIMMTLYTDDNNDIISAYATVSNSSNPILTYDDDDDDEDVIVASKVICTELYEQGLLSESIYEADDAFGKILYINDPEVMEGYHLWAKPVVKLMQNSKLATHLAAIITRPWAKQMAYEMGAHEKGSIIGKILMETGKLFSRGVYKLSNLRHKKIKRGKTYYGH